MSLNSSKESEKFTYVGCVHGGDDRLFEQLSRISTTEPPDHLIFMGDVTGSPEMEELKRRFYNLVQNRSKPLLHQTPDINDSQLLSYSEANPPPEAITLSDGYKALFAYQLLLEGATKDDRKDKIAMLSDEEIARCIRYISSLQYYGNFVSNLSLEVREGVLRSLGSSAKLILGTINGFRGHGTAVTMVGGNWDYKHSGVREIAGNDISTFNTMDFFRQNGIHCVAELDVLETSNAFHILVAYDGLLDLETISETRLCEIESQILEARSKGKAIIMIGHAEPNWKMHTLHLQNPPPNPPERDKTLRNFGRLIARFNPDQVAYPHQHNRIVDSMRREIGLNAKYVLERDDDGDDVHLVEDHSQIGLRPHQTLITYVPLRHIARGVFSRKIGQNAFDKSQIPINVMDR